MRHVPTRLLFGLLISMGLASLTHAQQATPTSNVKRASDYINEDLPRWIRFNGEYRVRLEGVDGVGFPLQRK